MTAFLLALSFGIFLGSPTGAPDAGGPRIDRIGGSSYMLPARGTERAVAGRPFAGADDKGGGCIDPNGGDCRPTPPPHGSAANGGASIDPNGN